MALVYISFNSFCFSCEAAAVVRINTLFCELVMPRDALLCSFFWSGDVVFCHSQSDLLQYSGMPTSPEGRSPTYSPATTPRPADPGRLAHRGRGAGARRGRRRPAASVTPAAPPSRAAGTPRCPAGWASARSGTTAQILAAQATCYRGPSLGSTRRPSPGA